MYLARGETMPILLHPLSLPRLALYQYSDVHASDRVLDIGTGAGFAARRWATVAHSVLGVDISPPVVALAMDAVRFRDRGRVRFECADAADPEFAALYAGQFDLVTSSDVFEHVEDPEAFVRSISTVLQPGGRAVVTFPNETAGHGVTSFSSSEALIDLFTRHGLRVEVRTLSVTGWADMTHLAFWRHPLVFFRRVRRTHQGQTAQPQVMHETWYCHAAGRPRRVYILVNVYARFIEGVMHLGGPVFRTHIVRTSTDITDRRVLIRAWRD